MLGKLPSRLPLVILVFLLCTLVVTVPQPIGLAQSVDALKNQHEQLQQKLNSTRKQIQILRRQENAARQNLGALQENLETTQVRIADTEYRLGKTKSGLTRLQKDLDTLEAKLAVQQSGTAARLRYLQRQGIERWWTILLNSKDLNEFFDRRYQLKLLLDADRQLIAQLQATSHQTEQQRLALESQKNEIALLGQELAGQRQELQQQTQIQQGVVQRISTQRSAFEAAQRRLEQDSRQITSLIRRLIAAQTKKGDPVQGTGRLRAPVAARISSGFGWRVHPIYGVRRFHSGLDFGVPSGTPVMAADRGTIIYAGWYGGYGNTVIINHGGGITTLYAHNSGLTVGVGQVVQRGQTVAISGSTGLSTGPHVHFEVRVNGQPVDPRSYL